MSRRVWAVLGANSDAARVAVKAAGCTHIVINADWYDLQPNATGSIDTTALANLNHAIDHAISIGLEPIFSLNIHYTPTWVLSSVEPFRDQLGNDYVDTNVSAGKAVRNWMWTTAGRSYVSDLLTRVAVGMGSRVASIDGCRIGGGWYGELHYPEPITGGPTYAWQGFGASMQTGVGLAAGMTVCPVPGYVPYTGTDAQDCQFLNWYLNGLTSWSSWLISQYKAAGFTKKLHLLLPGYGVRQNQLRTDSGYKQAAALGEDHIRAIGSVMHDPAVWPYSTWLNTNDGYPGGTADTDKSAWKSIYEKSHMRGKSAYLLGENTGGESTSGMQGIFTGALSANVYAGSPGVPSNGAYYAGCVWLDYTSLTSGGGSATLADYTAAISGMS